MASDRGDRRESCGLCREGESRREEKILRGRLRDVCEMARRGILLEDRLPSHHDRCTEEKTLHILLCLSSRPVFALSSRPVRGASQEGECGNSPRRDRILDASQRGGSSDL